MKIAARSLDSIEFSNGFGRAEATSDEQLAFKQKERELANYTRKVKNLFATMDQSGDGVINFEEFAKLVKSPMLQFLLSQWLGELHVLACACHWDATRLDLEYHDLLSLFAAGR